MASSQAHTGGREHSTGGTQVEVAADNRVAWVDYAKGICIFAVVTMYSTHHVQQILQSTGWMQRVVEFAQPFRMPDFFLISGLFVARVIDRPLRRYIDTKVLYFFYFYSVWVTFRFAYTDLRTSAEQASLLTDYLQLFVAPPSGPLWFIYILALFFIAARLARKVNPFLVLVFAAALQIADLRTGMTLVDKFAHYFVFFWSGHLFASRIFRIADAMRDIPRTAALLLTAWCILNAACVFGGWSRLPGAALMLGWAGAGAVLLAATLCARVRWMAWLAYLGRHSIIIYLGFVIPLGLMRRFIVHAAAGIDTGSLTLLVTLASVAGALLLYRLVRSTPLRFLFVRPSWAMVGPGRRRPASAELQ